MYVAFLDPGTADADKLSLGAQVVDGSTTGQPHTGAQTAHLLVDDLFQTAFIRHATFDTFRYQFVSGVVSLEVAVRRTFGHRAQRTHAAVRFVRTALIQLDFARRFFSTCQHPADHHTASAS